MWEQSCKNLAKYECKNVIMVAMVKAAAHFEEADVWGKLFICTQCSAAR